jgi:glutamate-5-semialdehyde dehydrogenase
MDIILQGQQAKCASKIVKYLQENQINQGLQSVATQLTLHKSLILAANQQDIALAKASGMSESLLDRLTLTDTRLDAIIEGVRQVRDLPFLIGQVDHMQKRPNGLLIGKKRVPLGVVGMIYEARPNVTVDAFALCFKTANTVLLRGGKEAFYTNRQLVEIIRQALANCDLPMNAVQLVQDTSRQSALAMMKMHDALDVLIPRGSASLIETVVTNSTVPVIETGTGNCHLYVDEFADLEKALAIAINGKTQRPGVCNALETILVHERVANDFLAQLIPAFKEKGVAIRGDEFVQKWENVIPVTDLDYATEFLDKIIAIRVVLDYQTAITHIETYSSGHSECIVTENYTLAQKFLDRIDSAAVYVNASTRFTDGFEFGFGAEIGISTQKLHARGPMGLEALTTTKYIIYGQGQCRP